MTLYTMKNLICTAIVMSVALLPHVICGGRRNVESGTDIAATNPTPPSTSSFPQSEFSLLTQLLGDANENSVMYNELKNYNRQQPNYLAKWPGLRDLLLTAVDYDDEDNNNSNDYWNRNANNNELANSRFIERLRQLAAISSLNSELEAIRENNMNDEMIDSVPTGTSNYQAYGAPFDTTNVLPQMTFKQHGTKKNVHFRKQYMSPCHFKICNMGRKRDVKY